MLSRLQHNAVFKSLLLIALSGAFALDARAQQRPLLTEDVDIIKPGVVRIETGFEFLQDVSFPLSGLRGDLTRIADTRLSFGMAPNVEFQIEWSIHNLLSVDRRGASAVPLKLGANSSDTNDVGDVTLWMKMKLRNEARRMPALGFRFGVQLPNSNQTKGIGTNTTNFFGMVTAGKKLMDDRLNVFGNIGIGILEAPVNEFTQNDVLMYGLAGIYTVSDSVNLVGEVNGFHSTRKRTPLGTEDYSQMRLGAQVRALGVRWNAAGIFGLSNRAPKTGLSIGITYDWDAFTPIK
ncbi:MAG TPA: hypothetical protein VNH22_13755 [Blastocatellia bacterium]|jgi:hypothetical protein|nr:hypothetical protein [Blastocatellia bacterium]